MQGLRRLFAGRYTPNEHRLLWAILIASSGFVGVRLLTRLLEGAYRVRDLGLAPLLAGALFWSAGWWRRAEVERYAEYDRQDAQSLARHQANRARKVAADQAAAGPTGAAGAVGAAGPAGAQGEKVKAL